MTSRPPRGLSAEEQALWATLVASVKPLHPRAAVRPPKTAAPVSPPIAQAAKPPKGRIPAPLVRQAPKSSPAPMASSTGLDSHWERRLGRSSTAPDFSLDLHGHTLDQAYRRLDSGLIQAKAMGARLVLVVTGKPRAVAAADRAGQRGAIRAKILDWLAAGSHASDIAAIRPAHRRHGGEGALYIILRRR